MNYLPDFEITSVAYGFNLDFNIDKNNLRLNSRRHIYLVYPKLATILMSFKYENNFFFIIFCNYNILFNH